jgi:hypothetical protein
MHEQTFLIQAVLADSRGVWLSPTCAVCDYDLRDGGILCSKCDLEFCAQICWSQHVNAHNAGTAFYGTPVVSPDPTCFTCDRALHERGVSCPTCDLEFCTVARCSPGSDCRPGFRPAFAGRRPRSGRSTSAVCLTPGRGPSLPQNVMRSRTAGSARRLSATRATTVTNQATRN